MLSIGFCCSSQIFSLSADCCLTVYKSLIYITENNHYRKCSVKFNITCRFYNLGDREQYPGGLLLPFIELPSKYSATVNTLCKIRPNRFFFLMEKPKTSPL